MKSEIKRIKEERIGDSDIEFLVSYIEDLEYELSSAHREIDSLTSEKPKVSDVLNREKVKRAVEPEQVTRYRQAMELYDHPAFQSSMNIGKPAQWQLDVDDIYRKARRAIQRAKGLEETNGEDNGNGYEQTDTEP